MMARRVLLAGGMPPERVGQVVAMSDTMLDNTADPRGSQNRRIELLVMTTQAEKHLEQLFSAQTKVATQQAKDASAHGKP